ncbi:hypothetical protein [Actinoplanes sp. NPDC026623]|uniref:hypothetical protein n=1 Tax=Actinoplanes sp. NPDC026623 TaxID=3155610 RepID=UPI00340AAF62
MGDLEKSTADFSGWVQPEVVNLVRSRPDSHGFSDITGALRSRAPEVPVCIAEFVLIMRDAKDRIVHTQVVTTYGTGGRLPSFTLRPVPGADLAHTTVYAPQTPRTERPPAAGVSCDGS